MLRIRFYITTTFLLLTTFVFGQSDTTNRDDNKWTIGTILFSESHSYFDRTFSPNFFSGITIKRHLPFFTVRMGIEYVKIIVDTRDECEKVPDCMSIEGYTKEGTMRLGTEKGFTFKKRYRPYLALDIMAIKSYSDETFSGGFAGIFERHLIHLTGFGAMPTIGFEFKMMKYLSIALETRLRLIYTKTTDDIDNLYDNAGPYRQQKDEQFQMIFNRISALTLNFNF